MATVAFPLTAVLNIPEAVRSAGHATWVSYAIALVAIVLVAFDPAGDTAGQIRSGLMAAVLSFIGFESAATLGANCAAGAGHTPRHPLERADPRDVVSVLGCGAHGGLGLVAGGPAEWS